MVVFTRRKYLDVCTSMDLAHRRRTPDIKLYVFLVEA